jgi:hypothetical protein
MKLNPAVYVFPIVSLNPTYKVTQSAKFGRAFLTLLDKIALGLWKLVQECKILGISSGKKTKLMNQFFSASYV